MKVHSHIPIWEYSKNVATDVFGYIFMKIIIIILRFAKLMSGNPMTSVLSAPVGCSTSTGSDSVARPALSGSKVRQGGRRGGWYRCMISLLSLLRSRGLVPFFAINPQRFASFHR